MLGQLNEQKFCFLSLFHVTSGKEQLSDDSHQSCGYEMSEG